MLKTRLDDKSGGKLYYIGQKNYHKHEILLYTSISQCPGGGGAREQGTLKQND